MDWSVFSGFGGNFAATLAADVVKAGLGYFRGALAETEAEALTHCFEKALVSAMRQVSFKSVQDSPTTIAEVQNVLKTVLTTNSAATAFVSAALTGEADPQNLTSLADHAGLDRLTLPFDWERFLMLFLAELEHEIRQEAGSPESKLRSRLAISELFRLRCAVTELAEDLRSAVHRLTEGFAEVDPAGSFRDFLSNYLGLPGRPKPFGGRRYEMAALNDWVLDLAGSPKLLMVAPAGRGKSALVVHWLRQLPPDIAVVFVPVSARFQTAQPMTFLSALVHGLARLCGESRPGYGPGSQSLDTLRVTAANLMRDLSSRQGIVVVAIDGIDEALDKYRWAGLFPNDLPANIRILVSARQMAGDRLNESWMRKLAWDPYPERVRPFRLDGLNREGVAEVLHRMELPAEFRSDPVLVEEIFRLSEGDPLIVGLYAEQLWESRELRFPLRWTAAGLRKLKPGPEGFFERWLEDQRLVWGGSSSQHETCALAVLTILARLLGPAITTELREIMHRAYEIDHWSVRDSLAPVARFVIGDGVHQGYSLTHPRLSEFFSSPAFVSEVECAKIDRSIAQWGRDTLSRLNGGQMEPGAVPGYLVRYLGGHYVLSDTGLEEFGQLLSGGWVAAWKHVDPTGRGFLVDVQRVWDVALHGGVCATGIQVRCILCFGSIRSPLRLPPAAVFQAALDTGLLSSNQALNILAYGVDRFDFAERIEQLAPVLADEVGSRLADIADLDEPSLTKVAAIAGIARDMTMPDKAYVADKAIKAARSCKTDVEKTLAGIAVLDLLSPFRRAVEIRIAVERLTGLDGIRLTPTMVSRLAQWDRSAAGRFAEEAIKRHFSSTALAADPALSEVLGLLPASLRLQYVRTLLEIPLPKLIANPGGLLGAAAKWFDDEQLVEFLLRTETLPFVEAAILLSRLDIPRVLRFVPDLFDKLLGELSAGEHASLYSLDWTNLLSGVAEDICSLFVEKLLALSVFPVGSDQWMDLMVSLLPVLPPGERGRIAALALNWSTRNFDEHIALEILGKSLVLLPLSDQESARRSLEKRVGSYCTDDPLLAEPSHGFITVALMPYMAPGTARVLAEEIFTIRRFQSTLNTSLLAGIIPFLTGQHKTEAIELIRSFALRDGDPDSRLPLLKDAKPWLSDEEFNSAVARLFSAALAQGVPQSLASFLEVLPPERQDDLASRLFEMVKATPDWDEGWPSVVGDLIRVGQLDWLQQQVVPFLLGLRVRFPKIAGRLLFAVCKRLTTADRSEPLAAALEALPLTDWDNHRFIELIPMMDDHAKSSMVESILFALPDCPRLKQLETIEKLLPAIHALGGDFVPECWRAVWDASLYWP